MAISFSFSSNVTSLATTLPNTAPPSLLTHLDLSFSSTCHTLKSSCVLTGFLAYGLPTCLLHSKLSVSTQASHVLKAFLAPAQSPAPTMSVDEPLRGVKSLGPEIWDKSFPCPASGPVSARCQRPKGSEGPNHPYLGLWGSDSALWVQTPGKCGPSFLLCCPTTRSFHNPPTSREGNERHTPNVSTSC